MKQYIIACIVVLLQIPVYSQTFSTTSFIEPYPLEITTNKTTNLVFPYAIKSVDRGSAQVLVQKSSVDTILQIKAARQDFVETNLSVITTDGSLYSFVLQYSSSPLHLNYRFAPHANLNNQSSSKKVTELRRDNEADFIQNSELILNKKKFIHRVKSTQYKIRLQLLGVYTRNDKLYFQLELANNSNLIYPVELFRFTIHYKKQGKRTSVQEVEIKPLYSYGNTKNLAPNSTNHCVFVFPAFTIANSKFLQITMSETNGGRVLGVKVKDKHILKAKKLN